jgi:hypothetical protein
MLTIDIIYYDMIPSTSGLYGGMGVHLMKVVPNSAIMFLTYEIVNSWLDRFTVVDN